VLENLGNNVGEIFGGIGGGMGGGGMGIIVGITAGALNAPLALIGVIPAWLTTAYFTARHVYRKVTTRRARELEDLIDRLAQLTHEIITTGSSARLP
jgi:hypothetical protein